ncbi:hypothetical protein VTO42DRAFT_3298 [Malbranchea cinnamomea]
MPALPVTSLLDSVASPFAPAANAVATGDKNSTALHVVCAWPVSGQYGPGTRVLYYILIAACVFARKAEWLRNAYLAGALLFPAVAAVHGIVLAAVHVDAAVDMDVYGAFQLCSIGILAAPVTARLSRTYFYDPGRNTIFLWTGLILAGLLSLTVEFFRIQTISCTHDGTGKPVSPNPGEFPYGNSCGLTCSPDDGPFSPLRGGAANDIHVIPAPDKLTFGTATLLAAACCVPAILSLIFVWAKILELNWKMRFGEGDGGNERNDELTEDTHGAIVKKVDQVNALIRRLLSVVEVPVFGAAVLAIVIMGERNFFSPQVKYQTEPLAAIGQWAPIVGTVLAVLGSVYLHLATNLEYQNENVKLTTPIRSSVRVSTATSRTVGSEQQAKRPWKADTVAKALNELANYFSDAAHDRLDDSGFRTEDYPEVPGERQRNPVLPKTNEEYRRGRSAHGAATPSRVGRSASGVFSTASSAESSFPSTSRAASPHLLQSSRSVSPSFRESRSATSPMECMPPDSANPAFGADLSRDRSRQRRDTLQVPGPIYHRRTQSDALVSAARPNLTVVADQSSPGIVVSLDPDDAPSSSSSESHQGPPKPILCIASDVMT